MAVVKQMSRLLGLSMDRYYNSRDALSRLHEKYQQLKPPIEGIIEEHPAYGYPRIKAALEKQYGVVVNHKVLLKLLRLWGLGLKWKVQKRKRSWLVGVLEFLGKRANLLWKLLRESKITRCFQVIIPDITELYH